MGNVRINHFLPEVLDLPPGLDLHAHPLLCSGKVILQSLASCLPGYILDPKPHWHVIDACAAPGNKTTHLAAIMHSKESGDAQGRVFAFDKDNIRLSRLVENAKKTGTHNMIEAQCKDFLQVDPKLYEHVDAVLLDPSCSGSGTGISRMDYVMHAILEATPTDIKYQDDRICALHDFQVKALLHALSFPKVQRVVYSTCSIYEKENEEVVAAVLEHATKLGYRLEKSIPSWPRRGVPGALSKQEADTLVRIGG